MRIGLDRLRGILGVPGRRTGEPAGAPSAAEASAAKAEPPAASGGGVVVVTVLGLGGEALEKVLDLVQAECRSLDRKPVLVTDRGELDAFRRRRLIVEQVPDAEALAARFPDLPWNLYRERLFALIARRWRPLLTVSFGRRPDPACLAALEGR